MTCEKCVFWQDFTERVYAAISSFKGDRRGTVELRLCKFIAPPAIEIDSVLVYTDKDYVCNAFKEENQ